MSRVGMSQGAQSAWGFVVWLVVAVASIGLWLLPVFIAARRHTPNLNQVLVVDLLLGWTGIGWVVALVMALKPLPPPYPPPYVQYGPGGVMLPAPMYAVARRPATGVTSNRSRRGSGTCRRLSMLSRPARNARERTCSR